MKGIQIAQYGNYQTYLIHQASKLNQGIDWLEEYQRRYQHMLIQIIRKLYAERTLPKTGNVICLGARLGAEVKAFRQWGYSCIGVDINPGPNNPLVLERDFHTLDRDLGVFDIAYTNCLDHILDPDRFFRGILTVLTTEGQLIVLAASAETVKLDKFASLSWDRLTDVLELICSYGFKLEYQAKIIGTPYFETVNILRRTNHESSTLCPVRT